MKSGINSHPLLHKARVMCFDQNRMNALSSKRVTDYKFLRENSMKAATFSIRVSQFHRSSLSWHDNFSFTPIRIK